LVENVKLASGEFENCGGPELMVTFAHAVGAATSHPTATARSPKKHLRLTEGGEIAAPLTTAEVSRKGEPPRSISLVSTTPAVTPAATLAAHG
jgi:hypothetical protein